MNWWDMHSVWQGSFGFWFWPLILLDFVLKAVALWKSARHNQLYWFIALLIISSGGILPIIYLWFFQKDRPENVLP